MDLDVQGMKWVTSSVSRIIGLSMAKNGSLKNL